MTVLTLIDKLSQPLMAAEAEFSGGALEQLRVVRTVRQMATHTVVVSYRLMGHRGRLYHLLHLLVTVKTERTFGAVQYPWVG